VGKTAAATNVQGGELRENGQILAVATNVNPFFAARLDSDGDLIVFRKDNTTVGSIGTGGGNVIVNSASNYGILQNAGSNQYVWSSSAGAGAFYPEADNSKDLGTSSKRFQDLYLSGGVYLGGTGSANHLDDYEEGTWTPAFTASGGGTITHGTRGGYYVKIGQNVFVTFNIRSTGVSGISGNMSITGLPFAVKNNVATRSGGSQGFARNWGSDMPNFRLYSVPNTTSLDMFKNAMNANTSPVTTSDFSTGADNNVGEFSITYVTD
jgi:hypothetical protein